MNNNLKNRIMRRIYFVWFSKKVLPYLATEALVFTAFLYLIGQNVYVAMVLKYANEVLIANVINPAAWMTFATGTFIHTRLVVQISVLGSLLAAALLFKNIIASIVQLALSKETKLGNRVF